MAGRSRVFHRRRPRRVLWALFKWSLIGAIWTGVLAVLGVGWLAYDLPDVGRLAHIERRPAVTLIAADGSLLATYGDLYGEPVNLQQLPAYVPQAVLATEDRRFYRHFGIDPIGLARAAYVNLRHWRIAQGGSTITQQLAKNVFLTPARTLRRKGQELLLAWWLEWHFTKEEILTLYLNRMYFGAGTYGIDAAARKFFGKAPGRLSLYEAAMLAGMLRAPSRTNPLSDPNLAADRTRLVLDGMAAAGYLSADQVARAAEEKAESRFAAVAPLGQHFADWVLDQVSSYVGYSERDLVVLTTLEPAWQRIAEAEVAGLLDREGETLGAEQAALVALERDGAVRVMVGGRDYRRSQFNRAAQALRQPGSAFKVFVYLAGFERGLSPDAVFFDTPISVGGWRPANFQNKYYGNVTLREAFARSLNSVAVQVSERAGRAAVVEAAGRLGITSRLGSGPSIALGADEVTLVDLTGAYGVFLNEGYGVWPHGIVEVRDSGGTMLYRREGSGPGRLVQARPLAAMLDILSATVAWGTGKAAQPGRPAAGKTGTSQDFRDAWFVGFTAELVAGVWLGNDDGRPMAKVTGGAAPARLWRAFMTKALVGAPVRPLPGPAYLPPASVKVAKAGPPAASADGGGANADLQKALDRLRR